MIVGFGVDLWDTQDLGLELVFKFGDSWCGGKSLVIWEAKVCSVFFIFFLYISLIVKTKPRKTPIICGFRWFFKKSYPV